MLVDAAESDKAAVREALIGQQLRHPHVVGMFEYRGALLTREFLDTLRGAEETRQSATAAGDCSYAALEAPAYASECSEDGLGDPRKELHEEQGWDEALYRLGVVPGKRLIMVVQELCDRGNMARAIRMGIFKPRETVSPTLARRMLLRTAAEICRGMRHLHERSVLHGDLKPANVLLASSRTDRRGFVAKVADFGLGHILPDVKSNVDTSSWGTLHYASPEALNGVRSKASDVYSFGMTLNEMVNGERPYIGLNHAQILVGVNADGMRPDWPADWPEVGELGRRCLAEDPKQRPSFLAIEKELVAIELVLQAESRRRALEASPSSASCSCSRAPGTPAASASDRPVLTASLP